MDNTSMTGTMFFYTAKFSTKKETDVENSASVSFFILQI